MQRAAPLARASRHPLAKALAFAAGPGPTAEEVHQTAGEGIEGLIDGRQAKLGRARFAGATATADAETEIIGSPLTARRPSGCASATSCDQTRRARFRR